MVRPRPSPGFFQKNLGKKNPPEKSLAPFSCRPSLRTSLPSSSDTAAHSFVRSRPWNERCPRRARDLSAGSLPAFSDGDGRTSQVPRATSMHACPALRPRRDFHARLFRRVRAAFRLSDAVGSRNGDFKAQSQDLHARCLRFAVRVTS